MTQQPNETHIIALKGLSEEANNWLLEELERMGSDAEYKPRTNHWFLGPYKLLREQLRDKKRNHILVIPITIPHDQELEVHPDLVAVAAKFNIRFVAVSEAQNDGFKEADAGFKGYFHNTPDQAFPFRKESVELFKQSNFAVADAIVECAQDEMSKGKKPLISIQNKDLYFTVGAVREQLPDAPITFFSHQAVTNNVDALSKMPGIFDIVKSLSQADTLFFHSQRQANNFKQVMENVGQDFNGKVGYIPLGVEMALWEKAPFTEEAKAYERHVIALAGGRKMIAGVDRCDRFKHIPERMKIFDQYLEEHPEQQDKVALIQAIPLDNGTPGKPNPYAALNDEIMGEIARINNKWEGRGKRAPIIVLETLDKNAPESRKGYLNYSEVAGVSRALAHIGGAFVVSSIEEGYHMGKAQDSVMRHSLYKTMDKANIKPVANWVSINAGFYDQKSDFCVPFYPSDREASVASLHDALTKIMPEDTVANAAGILEYLHYNTPERWMEMQLIEAEALDFEKQQTNPNNLSPIALSWYASTGQNKSVGSRSVTNTLIDVKTWVATAPKTPALP